MAAKAAPPDVSDAQLIARCIVGDDRHAFAELVKRHQSAVRACLRKLTAGNHALADDLAQDPIAVLSSLPDVEVRSVSESQADAGCSVAGAYLEQEDPPVLAVAASLSIGRRGFTVLHGFTGGRGSGHPGGGLIELSPGQFHGVTRGGSGDGGVVYRLGQDLSLRVLHRFADQDNVLGYSPSGRLLAPCLGG